MEAKTKPNAPATNSCSEIVKLCEVNKIVSTKYKCIEKGGGKLFIHQQEVSLSPTFLNTIVNLVEVR